MYTKAFLEARKTKAPAKDRIAGSENNPKGSAKSPNAKIVFSDALNKTIKAKVLAHNKKYPNRRITMAQAKAVVRRGMGAYSISHHPKMGRVQWGLARLNSFSYLVANGKPKNPNYVQDNDLL